MNDISGKKHSGLTLVELLIAMTLGLFLIGGVIQVFLGTKKTYSVVTSQSYAQESGRFALFFITGGLRHAGYWGALGKARSFAAHDVFVSENAIVRGGDNNTDAADDILDATDDIYMRMTGDADSSIQTCLGTALLNTQVAIDHYYVAEATGSEQIPSLVCSSTVYDFDTTALTIATTGVTREQALVSGIENLQILYGVVGPGGSDAEQYLTAAAVTDWRDVRSVRVAALATSNDDTAGFENTTEYRLLDETYDAGTAAGDRRARVVFEQTTSLRNFIFKSTSS